MEAAATLTGTTGFAEAAWRAESPKLPGSET